MQQFVHVRSEHFPVLPGEAEELVNEGMYGKALARHLAAALTARGHDCSEPFCEDWGWAVLVGGSGASAMLGVYAGPADPDPTDYVCTVHATPHHHFSWRRLRFVADPHDVAWAERLEATLVQLLREDRQLEVVSVTSEFPW